MLDTAVKETISPQGPFRSCWYYHKHDHKFNTRCCYICLGRDYLLTNKLSYKCRKKIYLFSRYSSVMMCCCHNFLVWIHVSNHRTLSRLPLFYSSLTFHTCMLKCMTLVSVCFSLRSSCGCSSGSRTSCGGWRRSWPPRTCEYVNWSWSSTTWRTLAPTTSDLSGLLDWQSCFLCPQIWPPTSFWAHPPLFFFHKSHFIISSFIPAALHSAHSNKMTVG